MAGDKISSLPDDLLQHILSFLPSREAVQTCVLSHGWVNLWRLTPTIDLTWNPQIPKPFLTDQQNVTYEHFVENLLQHNTAHHLRLVSIELYNDPHFNNWVNRLSERLIKKLNLRCNYDVDDLVLPRISMLHLETLCLSGFQLSIIGEIRYSSLKSIEFYRMIFSSETINKLLSSCPVLGSLFMEDCAVSDLQILEVVSTSLKSVMFNNMRTTRLRIEAVKLEHISLIDAVYEVLITSNISSVTRATLSINQNSIEVLNHMPNLKQLNLIDATNSMPECFATLSNVKIKLGNKQTLYERVTRPESSFHELEAKKLEFYRAIVKMEQDSTDVNTQAHTDCIQSSLKELVKCLTECCKKYGLHYNPATLVELPSADDQSKSPALSRSTSPHDGFKYNLFGQTGTLDVKHSQRDSDASETPTDRDVSCP